ncbi:hypothetical protein MBLNU230_g5865t1 [Neophaeotheca triangularis]
MSAQAGGVPEQHWTTSNPVPDPNLPRDDEPVAEEPEKRVATEAELNEETVFDRDAVEAREEAEASSQDDEKAAPKPQRTAMQRTQSNWTTTTTTSSTYEPEPPPPRKRTWGEKINPFKSKHPPPVPDKRYPSREYKANILSKVTFQWMAPLMSTGYQRTLELNDIWEVAEDRSVEALQERLKASFQRRRQKGEKRMLLGALYDTNKREFLVGGACQFVGACLQVFTPFVMKYLIRFAAQAYYANNPQPGTPDVPAPDIGHGIGLVLGITAMQIVQSQCINQFIYRGMVVGGQSRAVLISVVFEKAMKLSGRAKAGGRSQEDQAPKDLQPGSEKEKSWFKKKLGKDKKPTQDAAKGVAGDGQGWGNGRIVNLMSVDTYRVDQACGMFHMVWTSPVQVIITLILLLINLGPSALSGFGLICIMMPLLGRAIGSLMRRRKDINKITDQRVGLTQEILSAVRFVKFFGWETSFLERLEAIRTREINKIAFLLSIRNGIMAVAMSMPIFASMLAFITYALTNGGLASAANIFSSLALFNALRIPLNLLPLVIGQVVDANASLGRVQDFLLAEERQEEATLDPDGKNAVDIHHADFTWERSPTQDPDQVPGKNPKSAKQIKEEKKEDKRKNKQAEKEKIASEPGSASSSTLADEEQNIFQIKDIDLSIGRNELVAVIGSVGSGKSSLLAALAGDMRRSNGTMTLGASRAFCPQYAWIQNATFKDNIVFGKEYNNRWYDQVIDACALRPDIDMLPSGDLTEIGERGITVSGGQKQRLNIARAIYFNSDLILMDDPLSAVDAHVGKHIMDQAICGLLQNKARVLATHQLHVLNRADRIVWMKEGGIHKVATFTDLYANDPEFQKLMATTAVAEKPEEKEEPNEDEVEEEKKEVTKKKKGKKPAAALMQQEERATSSVGGAVYWAYIKASGSIWIAPLVFILLAISQAANIVTSLWLSWWTSDEYGFPIGAYIGTYAGLGVVQALLQFAFSVALTVYGTKASKVMLHRAITRCLRAPMSFFDTTPLGRITNRFSKDVDTMDNTLTDSMRMFFLTMAMILSVFGLIIAYYYYFAVALGPLFLVFLFSASYYRASAREVKRHESVLRSVVFSRFSEAINGTPTIRAYGLETQFSNSINQAVNSMDGAYFLTFANQRWLAVRLDFVGIGLVFTVGILVVTSRFAVDPSIGGLVLSYILSIVQMIQFTVRQLAEVENNMNSTERIHYYGTELEEEAALHTRDVPPQWPQHGEIEFDNVQMRYRAGLPLVLQGLTMHVKAGERIGVVGRTGAGKSSIMSTLFRLSELSGGSIKIDGIDIASIGLADLRSRLAIIPQDPTLFKGSIRSNLDPFNEHSDLDLFNALRQADLIDEHQKIEDENGRIHLDTVVEDEGLNFSLGQRQLLALARALVRNSQIIVCDEATSSVDFETDQKIQKTIVRGFAGRTLLCIAHRLKTIIGYDRILVMDAGNVAELDSPINLYDQGGIFRGMCDRSGIRRDDFFNSDEARFDEASPTLERKESRQLGN